MDPGSKLNWFDALPRHAALNERDILLGRDPREQADEKWNRRMELELFAPIARTVQNTNSIFQGRFKQFPEYGEAQRAFVYQRLERMDHELEGHEFVACDRFTIADITALVGIDIGGRLADIKVASKLAHFVSMAVRWPRYLRAL